MLNLSYPQANGLIVGFDSAWTDAPKAPGAICAVGFDRAGNVNFMAPRLTSFAQALQFIEDGRKAYDYCLVALDQPTIVPNLTGMRPVERVAASLISFVGGGVQPANRSKLGMFCDASPVWTFRTALGAIEEPEVSRTATSGIYLIEVFPALALAGLHDPFSQRLCAPKYNPGNRRTFKAGDWRSVTALVETVADVLGIAELSKWSHVISNLATPKKADQDMLDSALCVLVGLIWRCCERNQSMMIGDTQCGYMIAPVSDQTRLRLSAAAERFGVPFS